MWYNSCAFQHICYSFKIELFFYCSRYVFSEVTHLQNLPWENRTELSYIMKERNSEIFKIKSIMKQELPLITVENIHLSSSFSFNSMLIIPCPFCQGGGGGFEPPTKFSKREDLTESWQKRGGCFLGVVDNQCTL